MPKLALCLDLYLFPSPMGLGTGLGRGRGDSKDRLLLHGTVSGIRSQRRWRPCTCLLSPSLVRALSVSPFSSGGALPVAMHVKK